MMENNFKRFLSLLLAFVMVFGMFPANVYATGGDTTDVIVENQGEILTDDTGDDVASSEEEDVAPIADGNVAKVGNTEYATIDEAIAAWTNGTTLTLLADVTLSDVITLKSTEHHILNLGTYTMTAASGKNAIVIQACGTGSAERTAITINADATNPGGINAGSKSVVYYKYADGGISTEDRPIIKINGGVFTGSTSAWGTAGIYTIGTAARKCATLNIAGGTFNCSINGATKSKLIVSGGTFNYSVGSQGDSTALRLISGGKFKTLGFMTADSNNTKFWFGTSMGNSNVGLYVDNEGYLVVGGPVITEVSAQYPAVASNATKWSSYLAYSAAATYGLFYTDPDMAIKKHGEANVTIWVKPDVTIPDDVQGDKTVVEEIKNNTALKDYDPKNLPTEAELEIELKSVGETIVYDVKPVVEGVKVEVTEAITFRLPVPASVTAAYAKVFHEGELMGTYAIQGEGDAKYVEISSADFSEFELEPVVDVHFVAQIGDAGFESLQDAVEAVKNGQTITVLEDITFTTGANGSTNGISYTGGASFTLDLNGKTLSSNLGNIVLRFKIGEGNSVADTEVEISIKNGKIVSGSSNWCGISAATVNNNKLTLNLNDLDIEANKAGDWAVKSWAGAVVKATGVDVVAKYAGGFGAVGGEIVLTNCTVDQKGLHTAPYMSTAVAVNNMGKMTVNSGTYSSVPLAATDGNNQGTSHGSWMGGVMNSGGTIIINGGTFSNGNIGGTATNPRELLIVGANGENGEGVRGEIVINGGTFNSIGDLIHCETIWGTTAGKPYDASMGITITDGNFTGVSGKTIGGCDPVSTGNKAEVKISGGSYAEGNKIDDTYLAPGFELSENGNGSIGVKEKTFFCDAATKTATIKNLDGLKKFRDEVNGGNTFAGWTVVLAANIDLANEEWAPIGYMGKTFKGTFDGGNFTISNLKITKELANTAANNGIGLFGRTDDTAVIKNLTIENVDITGSLYVGAVVGLGYTGKLVENVTVKGDIAIDAWWYAGVIGGNGYMNLVNDCHVIGNEGSYIKGNNGSYIGGIWGFRGEGNNKITNCSVEGLKIMGVDRVGGICGIGHYGNTISGCAAEDVTITADDPNATTVGLIVGACEGTASEPTKFENNTLTNTTAQIANGDGTYTKVENEYGSNINGGEAVTNYAVKIGNKTYLTLAAAVAAAKAGDEIVMLADVAEDVTVPAGVTFNGNGKTVNGTIIAGGDLTIAGKTTVTGFSAGYYNNTITIGEGASLKVTSGRMTVSYGNVFNITGSIVDAKTAEKTAITPSLELVGGISYTGNGGGVQFNATNAYIKLGDSSTKNSGATGEFYMNFDNCIVDYTKTLKTYMPTVSGLAPKFNFNAKDSVVNFASHLELWLDATTMTLDNTNMTVGGSFANAGVLNVENGSSFIVKAPIMSSHGGNTGTIAVKDASFELKDSNEDWQNAGTMTAEGTGKLITNDFKNVNEGAVVLKSMEASFEGKQGITVTSEVEGYDVAYNESTGKYEFTKAPVAQIGEQKFETLEAAFKAATSGCTIEILQNVIIDYKWDCRDYAANGSHSQFKESVTIKGNGKTIKFTGTVNDGNWNTIFRFEENATVENLTIDISEATGAQRVITAKKSLSVDGLTIIGNARYGIIFGEGSSAADLAATEIVVKDSTLTGTRRAISDNEGGKDVKSVTVTGNTLNANIYVSASEKVVFSGNTANGEVDIRSYGADNVLSVEAKDNTLTEGVKNYIYAKTIDAQDEFATENPPVKVSTKTELNAALAAAKEGDTIVLTADIDYGTDQLAITKAITLDLGDKTLTTRNAYGGMSVKGNPTIKNGMIVHASNTAAIKVWNATAFEDLVIDVQGKGDANKTIGGIVLQSGTTTRVGSIKNVTIKGAALTNGIETYNCGDATENVIGSMENVTIDALGTGLLISAPCGTATNCNISGDKNAIELWIKGTYSASLTLDDSKVEGTVSVHDENASNVTNNGTLSLIVDKETSGVSEETVTLTINHAKEEQVKGEVLETIIENAQAKVNGTYYATVAEAMAAVTDGATVTILEGTYNYALVLNPKWNNVTVVGEGNVTMNGVPSIKGTGYKVENIDFVYGAGSTNLSGTGLIKDCSFTATNASGNTFRYCYGVKNGAITFEGCKLNAPAWAVHFDGASGTDLTFTDCEINGRVALAGDLGSLTATGTTFENGYVNVWGTEDEASFTGCDFVNVPYVFTGYDVDNVVMFNDCEVNGDASGDIGNLVYGKFETDAAMIYVNDVLKTGVAMIGENRYATLAGAVAAVQAGETIVMRQNVTEEIQIPEGAELTLDLNGKTLNGYIKPFEGNLTVENGSIVNTNKSVSGIEINAGKLVLNNVNITSARHAVRVEGAATVTIDGGEFKIAPAAKGTYHAINVGGAGGEKVTIKGGTFIGPKGTMADSGAAVHVRANAEVIIEGGSFSGGKLGTLSNAGKLTVTGGTFDQNPVAYIPEDYVSEKQEDGTYKVRQLKDLVIHVGPVTTRAIVDVSVATMDEAVAYAKANPADSVTYKISGPVELTTGGSHGILNLGKNVTIEGVTPDAKLTIVGGGVPDIKGVTFKNLTLADEGTYLPTANEFMYQNYIDCSFENVTFVDGIRLSGKSTLTGCTVNVNTTNEYAIWLDEGEFTMTGSTVTGGNDAYGLIKSDKVSKITITGNTFEYLGNANKEALNVKGASIKAENNIFIDCDKGILPADKTNYAEDGAVLTESAVIGDNKVVTNVAEVNGQKFETLEAAYAAAQNGDEAVILKAGSYKLPTGKNITITGKVDGIVFDNIGAHGMGGASVTFNNVTFDYYPNVNYTGLQHSGNLEYNNCTINGQVFLYGQSETFNNCTFNQNSADAYNVWTYGAKDVAFNDCTFNSVGKSVLVYTEETNHFIDLDVARSTFNASAAVDGKAAIEIDTSLTAGANITIDDATTATGFSNGNVSGNSLWNNKKGNNTDANNDVTVKVGDETVLAPVTFAAYIGKTGYTTIAAAIAAAQAGETVVLNGDVTLTESLVIGKAVILDLNGKTIAGTDNATGSFGLINIQPGAELTINDTVGTGKITLTATNNRGWGAYSSVISNQRGKLTVNGGTIEHLGGTDMAYGIDNLTNGKGTYAELVINGGTIKSTYRAIRQFLNGTEAQNILTINGGTIEGANKSVWMQDANKNANPGSLTIGANAAIKGNVYVTASAGSTEWPVELSVADAALKEGATVLTSNIPATYVVEKNNGVWGVSNGLKGSGTEADPYQIGTLSELILFRDSVNAGETKYNAPGIVVALTADIDMAGTDWSVNIGDDCNATFDGIFDGRNCSIKNLTSVETAAKADGYVCSGLFGAIYGDAVVKNLTIENVNINTGDFVGNNVAAVVGFAYTATGSIENVTVTGDIKINAQEITGVGAIVGYVYKGDLDVKNCSVKGNDGSAITGAAYVGGIVGYGDGKMTVSNASVEDVAIKATSCSAAGIAGIMLEGGEVNGATVKNVTVTSAHANWQNAAAIAVGTITGTITVSDVTAENVNVTAMVGAVHANKPTTPVAKVAAKIGNKYYTTFAAAYAAANEGETVTLLAPIVVAAGETLTLDKDVTVTYTSNVPGEDMITNRGNLVIDGTTLVYTNTDTTASNVTVSTISTEAGSTLEVKSGTVKNDSANNGSKGIYAYAIDILTNGSLGDVTATISGGEIICTNYMAIRQFNNGTACKNTLNVTGGKIYGGKRAIQIHMNNDAAYTTISGGTVEAGEGGYALCFFPANATHIAVTGGTFTGAVYSATNGFISGGTYGEELYEGYIAEGYATTENADGTYGVIEQTTVTITVGNATMVAGNSLPEFTYTSDVEIDGLAVEFSTAADGKTAGEFEITATVTAPTDSKYVYEIVPGKLTVEAAVVKIKANNVTTYYASFDEAWDAAPGASKGAVNFTLLAPVTLDRTYVYNDTNGGYVEFAASNWKNFTITGTTEEPLFKVESGTPKFKNLKIESVGDTFYVTGGSLSIMGVGDNSQSTIVTSQKGNVVYTRGGSTTILGGPILTANGEYPAIQGNGMYAGNVTIQKWSYNFQSKISAPNADMAIYWPQNGTLNISFGEITGKTALYAKSGTINISGGTFTATGDKVDFKHYSNGAYATGDAVVIEACKDAAYETPNVTITGGTFTSANADAVKFYSCDTTAAAADVMDISGGSYSTPVAEEYCAEGYIPTKQAPYTVKLGKFVARVNGVGYETIAEAIDAAVAGETVVLVAETEETEVIIDKAIMLDVNGINLTASVTLADLGATVKAAEDQTVVSGVKDYKVKYDNGTYSLVKAVIAKIGNVGYSSLQEAVDAAKAGATITLVCDAEGPGVVIDKNLTIDFRTFNYTLTEGVGSTGTESNGFQILKGTTVILRNGTLKVADEAASKFYILIQNYSDSLTLNNMVLDGRNLDKWSKTDGDSYVLSNNSGKVTVNSQTKFIVNNDGDKAMAFDVCDKTDWGYALPTITVSAAKAIYKDETNLVENYKQYIEAAAIISNTYYATLQQAVDMGGTVNLFRSMEGPGVVIRKDVNINFGGFTYSVNEPVGSTGTVSNGFQILKGTNVVLRNGTLEVAASAADKVYILVQNYSDSLSMTGITLDGTNLDKWSKTDGDSYTLSNNNGTVSIGANTTIIANNDGALAFAFDVCDQTDKGYEILPIATVHKTAVINGNIEAAAKIGNVYYATLQAALDAAKSNQTVTLVSDIKVDAADAIKNSNGMTVMFNIEGKSLTLDMAGKTIDVAYDSSELMYAVVCVADGASLTVKGEGKIDLTTGDTMAGSYDCVAYMFLKTGNTGVLNIENGTFTANKVEDSMVYTTGDKVVSVKGGDWTLENVGTGSNKSPWIFNSKGNGENSILVSGGTYNYNVGLQHWAHEVDIVDANGNLSYVVDNGNGTWTVTGKTAEVCIMVDVAGDYDYPVGYATFKDAVASIAKGAAETTIVLQKDITVKGQFIGHSYAQKVVIDLNGYTMSSTDKTLTVYRGGTEVTIKNGTASGNTTGGTIQVTYGGKLTLGENVTVKSGGQATAIKVDANSTLIIDQDTTYVLGGKNDLVVADGAKVEISAGYFKYPVKAEWCAEGYIPTEKLPNGYYSVEKDPSIGKAAKIGNAYYVTLQEAIEAAKDGDTITVLADIAVDTSAVVANSSGYAVLYNIAEKAITIDLNGKKIEATVNAADVADDKSGILLGVFCVDTNGTLTLTGNGTVTANAVDADMESTDSHLYALMVAYGAGSELTVENGTYHANSVNSALVYSQYDEVVIIDGGTYTLGNLGTDSNGSPWLFNAKGQNTANILVNGGTFAADIVHQYYPFEVQMPKELALKLVDGMYTTVPAVAYVNEQKWSSKWYTNDVGYATVEEAVAAAKGVRERVVGKVTHYSECEVVTILNKGETVEIESNDVAALDTALLNGGNVTMTENMTVSANDTTANSGYGATGVKVNGGTFNGNGNTLNVPDANGTWDCAVNVTSGVIQNVTVTGAFRGIFMGGANGDVYINNVTVKDVVYTFNSDGGNKNYGVYISNSTLNGWTSFSDVHKEVVFTGCTFGEGNGYAFCRPYNASVFENCVFEVGFEFDTTQNGNIVFKNCYYGDTLITAENAATLGNGETTFFFAGLNGAVIK